MTAAVSATVSRAPARSKRAAARSSRIRVLIADDHAVVRAGLVAIIDRERDMLVVAQASNGREAAGLWQQHRPDVTLLDLRMPVLDGMGALQAIRAADASARIIVLTTFDSDEEIYRGLRAGAKAYLLKDAAGEELVDCIRTVQAGGVFMPPAIAGKLAERVCGAELTGREGEVLRLLSQGKSNKEIGRGLFISETTVKSHMKGIFGKLHVMSRSEAIAAASRRGLIRL
jgi:DNA-binding NarL/FixJ family response regulator